MGAARHNPRPMGLMVPGSVTHAVKEWLDAKHHNAWWTKRQIVVGTERHEKTVDWALIYLRSIGEIECAQDAQRNSRYLRYRSKR